MLTGFIWRALARARLDTPFVLWRHGAIAEYGWFRSYRARRSVDLEGRPLPFISYPAIEFLARRVRPEMSVFEFGSGASTLWWADRVKRVVAVEHDEGWYREIGGRIPANVRLDLVPLEPAGAYARRAAEHGGPFDIVVVDGRDRASCAFQSVAALAPEGVIVWDDTERERYEAGQQALRDRGFRKLEFVGIGPVEPTRKETSIFYRPDNCLGI